MSRAIELARMGQGKTSPNPCVGAVVVKKGRCLGEGYHRRAGGAHAEVAAVRAAMRRGYTVEGATLYVTLEPCSTHGRTPPCTDLILKHKIKRVVVGTRDPNPSHRGRAFRLLRREGIEVKSGVLRKECEVLNREFNHWVVTGRPWVVAKMAVSLDGKLTRPEGQGRWLTSAEALRDVHRERARCDAILVGAGTVREDNPRLTVRGVKVRRQPWRVVITKSGKLPARAYLFSDEHKERTIVYRKWSWARILEDLGKRNVLRLMVEGGGKVLNDLARSGFVNEVMIYCAPVTFSKVEGKGLVHADRVRELPLRDSTVEALGPDWKLHGFV